MSNRPTRKPSASTRVYEARQAADKSRHIWIFVGVGVLVAVVAIAALAAGNMGKDTAGGGSSPSGGTVVPSGSLAYGPIDVSGEPLPPHPDGAAATGVDPAIGKTMPGLKGQTFDSNPLTLSADGKAKVIMFLAHWCPHCQKEVPLVQKWLDDNGMPSDVELFAVATGTSDSKPNFPPGAWLRQKSWSVPTIVDDRNTAAAKAFGLSGFPFFVAVGPDGKVVARTSGELPIEQFKALLDAARTGTPIGSPTGGASSPSTSAAASPPASTP